MDPQACFNRIIEAIKDEDFQEAFDAASDLRDWLASRGFSPIVPQGTYITLGDGSEFAYTILSLPERKGGGAQFTRWRFSGFSGQFEVDEIYKLPNSQAVAAGV